MTAALFVLLALAFVPEGIRGPHAEQMAFLGSGWLSLIPGLIGVALAVPLLLDLENGTTWLAWTQSVTRRRWLGVKVGVALATAVLAGALYSLLFTWYGRSYGPISGRWEQFSVEGIVPIAYVLLAFGLTLAIGAVVRRSAAAVIVGFGGYFAAWLFVQSWLRWRFVTPLTRTWRPGSNETLLPGAWTHVLEQSNRAGRPLDLPPASFVHCISSHPAFSGNIEDFCLRREGWGYMHAVYQPASRFWEFQGIEFALFAGVGLLFLAFAAWRILRID